MEIQISTERSIDLPQEKVDAILAEGFDIDDIGRTVIAYEFYGKRSAFWDSFAAQDVMACGRLLGING